MEEAGLCLNANKFLFMASQVTFLGYKIDAEGFHPFPDNVCAVGIAPGPKNTTELKVRFQLSGVFGTCSSVVFLGLLMYYGRFLANSSTVLSPLYRLLRKDVHWMWSAREKATFKASKQLLTSAKVLVHYNPELELVVASDLLWPRSCLIPQDSYW